MWFHWSHILVKRDIIINRQNVIEVVFKNCATFTKYITKIDGTTIDDDKGLDLVLPIYNLISYSSNYSKTTPSLWFYPIDEFDADIVNNNNFKSFEYKTKLFGNTAADGANEFPRNAAIVVLLKYLNSFWK